MTPREKILHEANKLWPLLSVDVSETNSPFTVTIDGHISFLIDRREVTINEGNCRKVLKRRYERELYRVDETPVEVSHS